VTSIPPDLAHAKINLYLHVTGRRPDGYHLLDSLAVFAGAADRLEIAAADGAPGSVALSIVGPFGAGLQADAQTNLVLRAAAAIRALLPADVCAHLPAARITLEKNLPVASGIGGGSADAASAIRLLRAFWADAVAAHIAPDAWHGLATSLGADVPVCMTTQPMRMQGIGEILTPGPVLPPCAMVLVNCGRSVSTPAVFRSRAAVFTPDAALPQGWATLGALVADLAQTRNDLEDAARALCPEIGDVLTAMTACPEVRLARMSGSGATCFALCDTVAAAQGVAARLSAYDGWWVWAGPLAPGA